MVHPVMLAYQFVKITVDLMGKLDITVYCILDHDKTDCAVSILHCTMRLCLLVVFHLVGIWKRFSI